MKINKLISNFLFNDIHYRLLLWKSNIESVEDNQLLFGHGTYANDKYRLKYYKKNGLKKAISNNYNAHNQFVETFYSYGTLGLLLFLFHIFIVLNIAYKTDKKLILFYFIFLFYFFTESILIRNKGIFLYLLSIIFIYYKYLMKNKIEN